MNTNKSNNTIMIVDLEATCWEGEPRQTVSNTKVIEIGAVIYRQPNILQSLSLLVDPVESLSDFCTSLTGITDDLLIGAEPFKESAMLLDAFSNSNYKINAWGSWGAYDKNMLLAQSKLGGFEIPFMYDLPHINLKNAWQKTIGRRKYAGMKSVLNHLGIPLTGNHHRALDDCINIAKILPHIDPEILWENID